MRRLVPLNGRVFVRRDASESLSPGGIAIPDAAKEKSRRGTVLAVCAPYIDGRGIPRAPAVAPGDRVRFGRHAGEAFTVDDRDDLLILREEDLLAKDAGDGDDDGPGGEG